MTLDPHEESEPRDAKIIRFPTPPRDRGDDERRKVRDVVGEVLRQERTRQERTLADVAEDAAISLPYLSEIERGRKEVSSDLLESVCDALDIEVATVLEIAATRLRLGSHRGPQMRLLAA